MNAILKFLARAALAVILVAFAGGLHRALADDEANRGAIVHLMKATFDKPESPLTVAPVSVEADYAVAGWAQGGMGGRALLRRKEGEWKLVLCSGSSLRSADALRHIGLPDAVADTLAGEVVAAEAGVDQKQVALFDRFDGTVVMDEEGNHPHDEHHHDKQ
jgi:hypothetical protein